jgi:hypothetical protein
MRIRSKYTPPRNIIKGVNGFAEILFPKLLSVNLNLIYSHE